MKALLDTNICIHRETTYVIHSDIGLLFNWLDKLKYEKYIHQITIDEIQKYQDEKVRDSFHCKLRTYNLIPIQSQIHDDIIEKISPYDNTPNDINDTILVNEVYLGHVDVLITEDKLIHHKAELLGITKRVYLIDDFIEKATVENPSLMEYRYNILKPCKFGNIDVRNIFFDSFRDDYPEFNSWFAKKAFDDCYVTYQETDLVGFLYIKVETADEDYRDIVPKFHPNKRLKVGSLKTVLNGYRLGERLIYVIFNNAIKQEVNEIYITIHNNSLDKLLLINLIESYGFVKWGIKGDKEEVYVKNLRQYYDPDYPKQSYPFIPMNNKFFIVPIQPQWHTELLPDSMLNNESPYMFAKHEPYRNSIEKIYTSRSIRRDINPGDVIIFYRTSSTLAPAFYTSVITSVCVVTNVWRLFKDEEEYVKKCLYRSVFTKEELSDYWKRGRYNKPFVISFLYSYSLPKRLTRKTLLSIGINEIEPESGKGPQGLVNISKHKFIRIIEEANCEKGYFVDQT